jgi:serine/threonine protein phosphatase PrpC
MDFEYGTVSVRGKSHIDSNLPNQDYIEAYNIDDTVILIAADGAGSASRSDEGSRRIISKVLDNLKNVKDKKFLTDPFKYEQILQKIIKDSIDELRINLSVGKKEEFDIVKKKEIKLKDIFLIPINKTVAFISKSRPFQKTINIQTQTQTPNIIDEVKIIGIPKEIEDKLSSEVNEPKLSDYASTFLLIISSPLSTLTAHIGDGYIIGYNRKSDNLDTEDQLISLPSNGEYDNQTYFFTDENWLQNIKFDSRKEAFDFCLILTDGADGFWVGPDRKSLHKPLLNNFLKIRENHSEKDLTTILQNVFTYEKIITVSTDDATIGMVIR